MECGYECDKEQDTLINDDVTIMNGNTYIGSFKPVEFLNKTKAVFSGPVEFRDTVTFQLGKVEFQYGNSGPITFTNEELLKGLTEANTDHLYKFNEGQYVRDVKAYIDSTYEKHYSGKYQATDMIIDAGHGTGFNIGNIMKYAKRYGKKGGYNKDDLMKIIHYAIIQLHVHNIELLDKKGSE